MALCEAYSTQSVASAIVPTWLGLRMKPSTAEVVTARSRRSGLVTIRSSPRMIERSMVGLEFGADEYGSDFVSHRGDGAVHAQPVVFGSVSVTDYERFVCTPTEIPVGEAPRPIWPVSVVISTSTNGRVLQSSTWRPTTDAIRIKGLPVPDDLSYNTATQTATKWQIAATAVKP